MHIQHVNTFITALVDQTEQTERKICLLIESYGAVASLKTKGTDGSRRTRERDIKREDGEEDGGGKKGVREQSCKTLHVSPRRKGVCLPLDC